jgi:hypothetical protein
VLRQSSTHNSVTASLCLSHPLTFCSPRKGWSVLFITVSQHQCGQCKELNKYMVCL